MQTESHSVLDNDEGVVPCPRDCPASSDAVSEVTETPLRLKNFIARGRGVAGLVLGGCIAITAVHAADKLLLTKQRLLRPITAAELFAGKQQLLDHLLSPSTCEGNSLQRQAFPGILQRVAHICACAETILCMRAAGKKFPALISCSGLMTLEEQ